MIKVFQLTKRNIQGKINVSDSPRIFSVFQKNKGYDTLGILKEDNEQPFKYFYVLYDEENENNPNITKIKTFPIGFRSMYKHDAVKIITTEYLPIIQYLFSQTNYMNINLGEFKLKEEIIWKRDIRTIYSIEFPNIILINKQNRHTKVTTDKFHSIAKKYE